ncbi:MAG: PepSY domain-containing protein [Tenacibaculum sp.]
MVVSVWRYCHLILALSSFIFILIASVTGAVLAFEPIQKQLKSYSIRNLDNTSVATMLGALKNKYSEVISVEINQNNIVKASVVTKQGKNEVFYIHPETGEKLGNLSKKAAVFSFATTLHRSLFLKSTGRFIIALVSLLLCIIALTGFVLICKRQGGLKKLFSKVVKGQTQSYYHVVLGKYTFIPIALICLTGIYLSLDKFSLLPKEKINHILNKDFQHSYKKTPITTFKIFQKTLLSELKSIEFPFSSAREDYFTLRLKKEEILVDQYTGLVLSKHPYIFTTTLLNWSLNLHTGNGSALWAFILFALCLSLLYFIYSGFVISYKRQKKSLFPKNKYKKSNAEYIILAGSENGNTLNFAKTLYRALLKEHKRVYLDKLNNYSTYKQGKFLLILTSTYGDGQPPTNARKFENLVKQTNPANTINYAVLGFGSLAYVKYCKYAVDIDQLLSKIPSFKMLLPLYKINNQSFYSFKNWVLQLNQKNKINIQIKANDKLLKKPLKQKVFTLIKKTALNNDNSFLIKLKPNSCLKFNSGDLLSIHPEKDNIERLYSIAKISNSILLSIKKHSFGICSNYLYTLELSQTINASIKRNPHFYFPKKAKEVLLISNGTGIAPFLGMLSENKKKIKSHLFWGGKTKSSFDIYNPFVEQYLKNKQLCSIFKVYSQDGDRTKKYVQHIIADQKKRVASVLKNKGCILICGSTAMMHASLKALDKIAQSQLNTTLNKLKNQIKTDCY